MNYYIPLKPESYYHVFNRANSFDTLFHNHDNYIYFLNKCEKYLAEVCLLHAFALLPNHFHFVIWTRPESQIILRQGHQYSDRVSKAFSNLFNSYTRSYNIYHRRRGTIFSKSFKRAHLDSCSYLKNAVLYVHHNAVHHNLCSQPEDWPYTSHRKVISDPTDKTCTTLLSWFGGLDGYLDASLKYNSPNHNRDFLEA
jgi:REP element-mobilizing transposase RayT